ncbi:glycerol-3-phosphate dehydrogenase, partial [Azospirillum brasilense]
NQQQSYVVMQAATTQGLSTLYSVDTASTGVVTTQILGLS